VKFLCVSVKIDLVPKCIRIPGLDELKLVIVDRTPLIHMVSIALSLMLIWFDRCTCGKPTHGKGTVNS